MNELLTPEERAQEVKRLVSQLQAEGRTDLLLHAIGVPLLEELRIEAAKGRLSRLVNPLDNAINEKCSRIKKVFLSMMDEYSASYYIISSHTQKHFAGSSRIWFERLKVISLPRELVVALY